MISPKDMFNFDKFITPVIIKIAYWVAVIGFLILGIREVIEGLKIDSAIQLVLGVLMIILFPLYIRVVTELVLVIFRIFNELEFIRAELAWARTTREGADSIKKSASE